MRDGDARSEGSERSEWDEPLVRKALLGDKIEGESADDELRREWAFITKCVVAHCLCLSVWILVYIAIPFLSTRTHWRDKTHSGLSSLPPTSHYASQNTGVLLAYIYFIGWAIITFLSVFFALVGIGRAPGGVDGKSLGGKGLRSPEFLGVARLLYFINAWHILALAFGFALHSHILRADRHARTLLSRPLFSDPTLYSDPILYSDSTLYSDPTLSFDPITLSAHSTTHTRPTLLERALLSRKITTLVLSSLFLTLFIATLTAKSLASAEVFLRASRLADERKTQKHMQRLQRTFSTLQPHAPNRALSGNGDADANANGSSPHFTSRSAPQSPREGAGNTAPSMV